MSDSNKKRLVVIGGGPGGYPAAFLAAELDLDVTIIDERNKLGGVCLNVGCIPSKALLHVAKLIHEAKEASNWGITYNEPEIDLDKLRAFKDKVITKLTGGLGMHSKNRNVKVISARAKFKDKNTVITTDSDGKAQEVSFDYCIIATGSRPAMPGVFDIGDDRVMDSTGALELKDIPEKLLVVGGGYIGLEMGSVYAALGSKVSVVEMTGGLLPGADRDLVAPLQKKLTKQFDEIMLDTKVDSLTASKKGIDVKLTGMDKKETKTYSRVLISIGRRANSDNLGIEFLPEIKLTSRGFIPVDAQRRTAIDNIFAIGDVAGEPGLAHKATHEGNVAVMTITGEPAAFDPQAIPAVVFTDPELAWTGLTEAEAKNESIPHEVVSFPWAASGRATSVDRNEGLTKLIVEPNSERILGVGMVGVGVGEMIAEGTLAIEMGATIHDLAKTIHPHPTLSETIMECAEVYHGHCAHYKPKK